MGTYWKNFGAKIKAGGVGIWALAKTSVTKWWAMDPFRQSAIIAYYAIFSLPALLVIIVSVAGLAFGADVVNGKIIEQISQTMGADTAEQIKVMLAKASETKTSVWATIIGAVTVILGSIGVFVELQKSLNIIWEVEEKPKSGVWGFLRARVFSFGLILSIAFMLMMSLVVSTVLAAASDYLQADSSKILALVFEAINMVISVGVISLLFSLMFKYLPDTHIKWRYVWVGGLVTGVLFTLGKTLLAFYFGKAEPGSGYGAAGSIILILLWVNYSSMILFLGAEFTHTYAEMREPSIGERNNKLDEKVETEDEPVERKEPNYSFLMLVPFVVPIVAAINYILPSLLPMVAKRLARKYGATVAIKRISIGMFKPLIAVKGLTVRYGNVLEDPFMVFADVGDISVEYKRNAFFKKQLEIVEVQIESPRIEINMGKAVAEKQGGQETPTPKTTGNIMPIILHRLSIGQGEIRYKNAQTKPSTGLSIEHIDILLSAQAEGYIGQTDCRVEMDAKLLDGQLKSDAIIRAGFGKPTFDMRLQLHSIDLTNLNDFFMAYGGMDLHKGYLDMFAEASVLQNNIKGFVKPLIKELEMVGPEDRGKHILTKVKESAIGMVKGMVENQSHDQVATEIPFKGKLDDPKIGVAHALYATMVNLFVQALKPNFYTLLRGGLRKSPYIGASIENEKNS